MRAYKNAIVDLYRTQRSEGVNNHLHPGEGRLIKDLMKSLRRDSAEHMRRNFHDRGRASFRMKSFGEKELRAITDYQWSRLDNVHNGLRDDMSEFNMRAMSMRGDHMRVLELPDLFEDTIEGQGFGECRAIIAVLNRGKTNQFGKAEFAGTMRHKDVMACAQSKLAYYFLYRFDMSEEGLPDFSSPQNWYNVKVFRGEYGSPSEPDQSRDVTKGVGLLYRNKPI